MFIGIGIGIALCNMYAIIKYKRLREFQAYWNSLRSLLVRFFQPTLKLWLFDCLVNHWAFEWLATSFQLPVLGA